MYFLKVAFPCLFLLLLNNGFIDAAMSLNDKIITTTRQLQHEVEDAFKNFNRTCESTVNRDDDFKKIVSEFLKENFTTDDTSQKHQSQQEKTKHLSSPKNDGFISKLKAKISTLIHGNKTEAKPVTKLKRCLVSDLDVSDLNNEAEVTIEKQTFNLTSSDAKDLQDFLVNFIKCLKKETNQQNGEMSEETPPAGN